MENNAGLDGNLARKGAFHFARDERAPRTPPPIPPAGFSLVELLVVIAIVAIIAALLLPGLGGAKNQAAKTADLGNLRQLMTALHLYADDNSQAGTWPNWDYGRAMPDGTAKAGWLYTPDLAATGTNVFQAPTGLLWNSLRSPKSYLCPMDRPDQPDSSGDYRKQQLSTYIMNGAVIGFRSGYYSNRPPVKIVQMLPGDCVLFEAGETDAFSHNDGSSWPSEGITARHLGGATIGLVDGSAGYVRDDRWAEEIASTNKNRLWCYPNSPDGGDPIYGHVLF